MAIDPIPISRMTAARNSSPAGRGCAPLAGDSFEDVRVDIEVGVDRVDVVLLLERIDQLEDLRGGFLVERDAHLGQLGDLGGLDLDAGLVEGGPDGREVGGVAE